MGCGDSVDERNATSGLAIIDATYCFSFFIFNFPNYFSPYFFLGLYVEIRKKAVFRNVYTRWYFVNTVISDLSSVGFQIETIRGQIYFPTRTPDFFSPFIKLLDRTFRKGRIVRFAPIIFVRCRK